MMRITLVVKIFLVFFIADKLNAQAPGYLGKRFVFGYGLNTSPAFYGSNANNETIVGREGNAERGNLAFNFIHEGFVEYAISAQWMVGGCTRYYKTTYDNATYMVDGVGGVLYRSRTNPEGYYTINGLSYCLYFKYYRKKYVAPWGSYMMFGPVLNTAKASYDTAVMSLTGQTRTTDSFGYYSKHDTVITGFGPREQSYRGFNLMLGYGKSRIVASRLVLDYGFNMYLLSFFPNMAATAKDGITASNCISKTINRRVRGINHFNVFLKIGVLLF